MDYGDYSITDLEIYNYILMGYTMETSTGQHSETSPNPSPSLAPSTNNGMKTVSSSIPPLSDKKRARVIKKTTSTVGITSQSWKRIVIGAHAIIVIKSIVVILPHVEQAHYEST
uniref:Uncharacterized protein n=1 Tax=Cucumis melo TaxID=3656 RepID=A0A9I9E590_CUCME